VFITLSALLNIEGADQSASPVNSSGDRIVALAEKMISVAGGVEDFQCNTEIQYYSEGKKNKRYRFVFFTEKGGNVRLRFSRPYPGVSAFYKKGDEKVTVQPFRFLPIVKFRLSLTNPRVVSPSGQRIDQGTIDYLTRFFYQNCELIRQSESRFSDEEDRIDCIFWAKDYTGRGDLNRYRLVVSKKNWFPNRIERFDQAGILIEVMTFKDYEIRFIEEND
jgi:outer membrane lipoprotein-sorting protein